MLDRILRIGLLFDFYGALLTDKQRYCLQMHYLQDLSLSEIADDLKVSRQAVHDLLKRAEQILEEYENKLKLVERYHREQQVIKDACDLLDGLPAQSKHDDIKSALDKLRLLLEQ